MIANFKKFQKGRKPKRLLFFLFILVLFIFLIAVFGTANWRIQKKRSDLKEQIEDLEKEIQALEEKNQKLQAGISQGASEVSLEREARENFNLKKPDERVVTVLPPAEEQKQEKKEKSFWQKFLDMLKFW